MKVQCLNIGYNFMWLETSISGKNKNTAVVHSTTLLSFCPGEGMEKLAGVSRTALSASSIQSFLVLNIFLGWKVAWFQPQVIFFRPQIFPSSHLCGDHRHVWWGIIHPFCQRWCGGENPSLLLLPAAGLPLPCRAKLGGALYFHLPWVLWVPTHPFLPATPFGSMMLAGQIMLLRGCCLLMWCCHWGLTGLCLADERC